MKPFRVQSESFLKSIVRDKPWKRENRAKRRRPALRPRKRSFETSSTRQFQHAAPGDYYVLSEPCPRAIYRVRLGQGPSYSVFPFPRLVPRRGGQITCTLLSEKASVTIGTYSTLHYRAASRHWVARSTESLKLHAVNDI